MPKPPRYPMFYTTWAQCQCCGRDRPSPEIRLTRKNGYRCRQCDGGDYDTDDIYYVYPANEGTRDTTAPLTNISTEGMDANDLAYNQFLLRDQSTGVVYLVTVGPDTVTLEVEPDPDRFQTLVLRCVSISSAQEMSLIIVDGELEVSNVVCEDVSSATAPLTVVPPGGLTFNPPDGGPPVVVIEPYVPCLPVLYVTEAWEVVDCTPILEITEPWEVADCTPILHTTEGWES